MLERGDDDNDDVDDEVRTTVWSQNRATATQCTEESFLRTQYFSPLISAERCGGTGNRQSGDTYRWSQLGSQLLARVPYI
jgi:hypothetical protein